MQTKEEEYKKYNSLKNHYNEKSLEYIKHDMNLQCIKDEFIVREKIHGCNIKIEIYNNEIKYGSRVKYVSLNDKDFFNIEEPVKELIDLIQYIKTKFEDKKVILYGELFGGYFPNKELYKSKYSKSIHKGVKYTPYNHIRLFDIFIDNNYINYDSVLFTTLNKLFTNNFLPVLFEGTLQECLDYDTDFDSTIPSLYNYNIESNLCEGIVITPKHNFYFGDKRAIIKKKNKKFKETVKVEKVKIELNKEEEYIFSQMFGFFCDNRLDNVISKLGEPKKERFGEFIKSMFNDGIEDIKEEIPELYEEFKNLDINVRNIIVKDINRNIVKLISQRVRKEE